MPRLPRFVARRSCTAAAVVALTAAVVTAQPAGGRPGVTAPIAVAPFVNASGHPADDWIGVGIAEAVATDLHLHGFSVIGPTAGGRAAGVLVSGTYRRLGDALHITVELVDVRSGAVVDGAKVDGAVRDLFEVQDRVTDAVVSRLAVHDFHPPAAPEHPTRSSVDADAAPPPPPEQVTGAITPPPPVPEQGTGAITVPPPAREGRVEASPVRRAGGGFAIAERPVATVARTAEPPTVDGRLDDPVWRGVAPITRFVQTTPVEGAPATEDTEVWLAFDDDQLYVAFYAHYKDPGIIRANRSDRDQTRGDDQMSVMFDPFLDQQRAYLFSVNAYGVALDGIVNASGATGRSRSSVGRSSGGSGGGGSSSRGGGNARGGSSTSGFAIRGDPSWNVLFEVRGVLVADGWTAEMAIPFKSLRYPARADGQPHTWGFQIHRNIRDKSESLVWSPVSLDIAGQLTQMGVLDGLTDLSTSRNLEILPTVTGVQTGALNTSAGSFVEEDPLGEVGIGVKYGLTSNLTFDFAYNPDFSQIESDRPQVEVNQRFALFYSEQRPFFLEGQEIFAAATPTTLVHTRTIVDPRYGGKLTGKVGRTTVGVFMADDEAPGRVDKSDPAFGRTSQSFIGRVRYDLYGDSYVGAIATDREFVDDYNRVGGVDGRLRLGQTHAVNFLAVQSDHRDSIAGDLRGPVMEADFSRQARNLSYAVSHSRIDPDFRTAVGFVPRVDIQRTDANVQYRWWPEGTIINWGPRFTYLRNHNHDGVLEDEQFRGEVDLEFVRNVRFGAGITRDLERFEGIDFRKTGASFSGRLSTRILTVNASVNQGEGIRYLDDPFLGRSTQGTVSVSFRPVSRLRTELRTVFSRFVDPGAEEAIFDVKIFRWRATYQFTDRMLLRHILEHDTFTGTVGNNVLLTYRVNAGTVAFLGYDDRFQQGDLIDDRLFPTTRLARTNRAFFMKIAYLFRY